MVKTTWKPFVNELSATLLPFQKVLCSWFVDERFVAAMTELYQKPANEHIWDLRLYDTTGICFDGGNALHAQTFKIAKNHHYWIIKGLQAGHSYVCELGYWTNTHEFFPLLRSNEIHCTSSEKGAEKVSDVVKDDDRQPTWRGHISTYSYYE
jgi:hypothetical protein